MHCRSRPAARPHAWHTSEQLSAASHNTHTSPLSPHAGTGAFDYDRDMAVLRREVAAVLARHLLPSEYDLRECIDAETDFKEGKRLFAMWLS